MTDWRRRVRPGEPLRIPAEAYNAFVDAAVAHRTGRGFGASGMFRSSQTLLRIANQGPPIKKFSPVPVDVTTEFEGGIGFSFTRDTYDPIVTVGGANTQVGQIRNTQLAVVVQENIGTGEMGHAVADGITWLRVPVSNIRPGQRLALRRGDAYPSSYGSAIALSVPFIGEAGGESGIEWFVLGKVGLPSGKWLARITGSSLIESGVARWQYEWVEVVVDKDSESDDPNPFAELTPGSWSHVSYGQALNLYEHGNEPGIAYGIPVAGTNFAINGTGVTFRAVPDGAIVEMSFASAVQGERQEVVFRAPNPVAGPCIPTAGVDVYYYAEDVIDSEYGVIEDGGTVLGAGIGST